LVRHPRSPLIGRACVSALVLCALAPTPAATAAEPRLTVPRWWMADALICYGPVGKNAPQPILFAPGTGSDGSQAFPLAGGAFAAMRRTLCVVVFPRRTTADLQDSVQYLVFAIRRLSRRAGRPIAVTGVSQGGLLIRMALTYWPSLRSRVSDAVTAAGTHRGSRGTPESALECVTVGCPPALWQQRRGSALLRALNDGRDETPGRTAYTTVRSATDEIVRPQTGPRPTSALKGAANILIQDVCPGRMTTHLGTVVDSVTIAALADAVAERGPARVSRLPGDVCDHPYGTGLDEARTRLFLSLAPQITAGGLQGLPVVRREPKVRPWTKRPKRGSRIDSSAQDLSLDSP
jgi:triacylglycerol lipase